MNQKRKLSVLLLLLCALLWGCAAPPRKEAPAAPALPEILTLRDPIEFSPALQAYLLEKSSREPLSPSERTAWLCGWVCDEVNADGFAFFFFNYFGEISEEIPEAYRAIGAEETAEICEDALGVFRRTDRVSLLTDRGIMDALEGCDQRFCDYPEDLNVLIRDFVLSHPEDFS